MSLRKRLRPHLASLTMVASVALIPGGVSADAVDDALIAAGKLVFEETAGGVGCALCHGMEAAGDPDAGAPYIRGASSAQVQAALHGAVPVMEFLELSIEDQVSVLAYLQYLGRVDRIERDPLIAAGQVIFEETAGGVGCMACHGEDGSGDFGPDIRGKNSVEILDQLRINPDMQFIALDQEQLDQVTAYLQFLHDTSVQN